MTKGPSAACVALLALAGCATASQAPVTAIPMRPLSAVERTALAQSLSQTLKDPGAAQFKWLPVASGPDASAGYCGLVNGKNSYGGYEGYKRFYAVITKGQGGTFGTGQIQQIEGKPITFGGDSTVDDAIANGLVEGHCSRAGYTDFSAAE